MEEGKEAEKRKGGLQGEDKKRRDSTSSVGSSVGSLENYGGKKREREEEKEELREGKE